MQIRLTGNRALFVEPFPRRINAQHGPQSWPWWLLFTMRAVRCNPHITFEQAPVHHWNLWLYTRWGAWSVHVGMDCRTPAQRGF